jgi:hypothetical protein
MRAFQGVVALNNLQNLSGGYFVFVGTGVTELVAVNVTVLVNVVVRVGVNVGGCPLTVKYPEVTQFVPTNICV